MQHWKNAIKLPWKVWVVTWYISKNKLKFKNKPWITPGLQKSLSIKSKLLSEVIKLQDPCIKRKPT